MKYDEKESKITMNNCEHELITKSRAKSKKDLLAQKKNE